MSDEKNNQDPPELKLEEVVELEPDELTDEHKTFLEEHKEDLTPEQAEKYGIEIKKDEPIDPKKVEIKTRFPGKKKEKPEGEEPEIDPDDVATIGKVVKKETADLRQTVQVQADIAEVNALLQVKPEFSKYRGVILKYMSHPAYRNIPAHNIAAMVAADDLQKIGAQKEREAQKKAKDTQGGGTTVRKPTGGAIDWSKATKEEVEAKKAAILGHRV